MELPRRPPEPRLKVALVTDWYLPRVGGLELQIRGLARALAASGRQVHVITSTPAALGDQGWRLPVASLPDPEGVLVHRVDAPLVPRYKFVYTRGAFRALEGVLEQGGFDVVHCMVGVVTPFALGATHIATRLGLPTVVTFHSSLFGFRHVLRGLDAVTGWSRWPLVFSAVSDVVARQAESLTRGRPVHVLPNAVEPAGWRMEPVAGDQGELRLVSVMRLNPRKRGAALLKAVARARRALPPDRRLHLTVVGDGPEGERLRRLARRLELGDSLRFAGYLRREEILDVFARSDAFVLASVLESFGVAALEARAAGLPVVARDEGGVKEFIEHGRQGLLAGSDAELSRHLVRLATDRALLGALTARARGEAVRFTWDESVRRHLDVYQAACGRRDTADLVGRPDAA